jgi:hypothetical protein
LDALLLGRLVVAYCATCCSTKGAVMTRQMACKPADHCSFDAAFGVSWYREDGKYNSYRSALQSPIHLMLLVSLEVPI